MTPSLTHITFLALLLIPVVATAQTLDDDELATEWKRLYREKQVDSAELICRAHLSDKDVDVRVEAHKCMANVLYARGRAISIERNDRGEGFFAEAAVGSSIDSALWHLEAALALAPEDESIHKGWLTMLIFAGRYDALPAALERCMELLDEDDPDIWLAYAAQLFERSEYEAGLAYMKMMEKRYPDDHRVVANIGGFHAMLNDDPEALRYARKGVDLEPDDPINNWNLARLYDYAEQPDSADHYYRRALDLDRDWAIETESYCTYADFVETKLADPTAACAIRKEFCEQYYEETCE